MLSALVISSVSMVGTRFSMTLRERISNSSDVDDDVPQPARLDVRIASQNIYWQVTGPLRTSPKSLFMVDSGKGRRRVGFHHARDQSPPAPQGSDGVSRLHGMQEAGERTL